MVKKVSVRIRARPQRHHGEGEAARRSVRRTHVPTVTRLGMERFFLYIVYAQLIHHRIKRTAGMNQTRSFMTSTTIMSAIGAKAVPAAQALDPARFEVPDSAVPMES